MAMGPDDAIMLDNGSRIYYRILAYFAIHVDYRAGHDLYAAAQCGPSRYISHAVYDNRKFEPFALEILKYLPPPACRFNASDAKDKALILMAIKITVIP
jgi:hypothetical protein